MKNLLRYAVLACAVLATAVTVCGQSRGGGAPASSSSNSTSSNSTTSVARGDSGFSSSTSSSGSYAPSAGNYGGSYSSSGRGYGGSGGYYPDLTGTSWNNYNTWAQWQMYMNYLRMSYMLNYSYLSRFSRNVEPLVTPELLRLTYRRPLKLSLQMLDAIDELAEMLQGAESGTQIDKQAVVAKIQEIRDLNKQILKDQGLEFLDQRRDKETLKGLQVEQLDTVAINRLRELVTDLSTQLKTTYSQTTPAVISVQSLSQPSFKSLCKEIDKMSKSLESRARRL